MKLAGKSSFFVLIFPLFSKLAAREQRNVTIIKNGKSETTVIRPLHSLKKHSAPQAAAPQKEHQSRPRQVADY